MFWHNQTKPVLEKARDEALLELEHLSAEDSEYAKIMEHVKTLSELMDLERPTKLNRNTMFIVGGNIGIAVLVIAFEKSNVVTTKVQSFLNKAT